MSNDNEEQFIDPFDWGDPTKIDIKITPEVAKKLFPKKEKFTETPIKKQNKNSYIQVIKGCCVVCKENLEMHWEKIPTSSGSGKWKRRLCCCPKCRLLYDH